MANNNFQWATDSEFHYRVMLLAQLTKSENKIKRSIVNIFETKGPDVHLTADNVFKAVKKSIPDIERGLIGGHLTNLVKHGFLVKVGYGHGSTYNFTDKYHDTKKYFETYKPIMDD